MGRLPFTLSALFVVASTAGLANARAPSSSFYDSIQAARQRRQAEQNQRLRFNLQRNRAKWKEDRAARQHRYFVPGRSNSIRRPLSPPYLGRLRPQLHRHQMSDQRPWDGARSFSRYAIFNPGGAMVAATDTIVIVPAPPEKGKGSTVAPAQQTPAAGRPIRDER